MAGAYSTSAHSPFAHARALPPARLAKLQHDQLLLVQRTIAPSVVAMPLFSVVISAMLSAWVPFWLLAAWVATVTAASAMMGIVYFFHMRSGQKLAETKRWTAISFAVAGTFGIAWIAPSLFFWGYCDATGHMLLALVFACCVSGCAALQSPCPPLLVATFLPYAMALIIPPLFQGEPFYWGLSALGLGFSMFMGHLARHIYVTARDMLLLREDKSELIEQLTAAKIESDKARQRAEAASQAKSKFLANMSHELRTPLNAILGFSEVMRDEVFGNLGSRQYVGYATDIHSSGEHLLGLINDVLDLSRIEAGRFVVRAEEINVPDAIKTAYAMFELRAANAGIRLKAEIDPGLPLLLADDRACRQILINLISNAVKFTPAGGTVTTFARRSAGGGMEVGVTDTGAGIDPADVAMVFEAFGQGRHDIAVNEKGTGLGLPIVRGLVEAHGGKVRLDSVLGKGTTVMCTFPRERLSAPQPVPIRLATVL
ncbi:MAG: sensor histidine kinase [Alphaproteobacteria bacterium]|nr:sensor histidine kinase [Alphaproteobacteria bacterium]